MNVRVVALIAGLTLVLLGAVLGARALLNAPVEVPRVQLAEPVTPQVAARIVIEREAPPAPVALAPVPREPVLELPPPPLAEVPPPPPPVPAMPDPIETPEARDDPPLSPAVEAAWALVRSDQVTPQEARNAADLFAECLRSHPSDWRCASGLKLARRLQLPRPAQEQRRIVRPELERGSEELE